MTDLQTTPGGSPPSRRIEIDHDDLPLHCPMEGMSLWNSHPRVYLPIEETGQELCPYCGTLYVLRDDHSV